MARISRIIGFCAVLLVNYVFEQAQTPFPTSFPTTEFGTCSVRGVQGNCRDVSACGGISVSGFCPGPSGIQCCVLDPVETTVRHTPAAPDVSNSLRTCSTPINGLVGQCIDVAQCTGATFNGLCPGSSAILCCVQDTNNVPDLIRDPAFQAATNHLFLLNFETFRSLYTGISATRAAAMFPFYNYALAELLLDSRSSSESCFRSAAFAAQLGHESAGLKFFEELVDGSQYEGRLDLGNTQPGDGRRFKGRGPIQLTGRANYQSASTRLGLDFVGTPEAVCLPSFGFLTTVDFWMKNNLNQFAGTASESNFITLTRRINGGTNGLTDRQNRWRSARRLLGCDSLQSSQGALPFLTDENSGIVISLTVVAAIALVGVVVGVVYKYKKKKNDQNNEDGEIKNGENLLTTQGAERKQNQRDVPKSYLESML